MYSISMLVAAITTSLLVSCGIASISSVQDEQNLSPAAQAAFIEYSRLLVELAKNPVPTLSHPVRSLAGIEFDDKTRDEVRRITALMDEQTDILIRENRLSLTFRPPEEILDELLDPELRQNLESVALQYWARKDIQLFSTPVPDWAVGLSTEKLKDSFETLIAKANKENVEWNGESAFFAYRDQELQHAVARIALAAATNLRLFINTFAQLPEEKKDKIRINTQTDDVASKYEPFDLLQGKLATHYAETFFEFNRIEITKMVHGRLYRLLGSNPVLDSRGGSIAKVLFKNIFEEVGRFDTRASGICADGQTQDGGVDQQFLSQIYLDETNFPTRKCGSDTYTISRFDDSTHDLKFPEPLDFKLQGNHLKVLVTFALTEETTAQALSAIQVLMASKGYVFNPLNVQRGVDTIESVRKDFHDADMAIPVAHLLDINSYHVGTKKSIKVIFSRFFGPVKVDIHAYFPMKHTVPEANRVEEAVERATFTRNEIVDVFRLRRTNKAGQLFVLNTSCYATENIRFWSRAYQEAVLADLADGLHGITPDRLPNDVAHVVAAERSFPTGSAEEILNNFYYPLKAIEQIAKRSTPTQIITEVLEQPPQELAVAKLFAMAKTFLGDDDIADRFKALRQEKERRRSEGEPNTSVKGFEPVYNVRDLDLTKNMTGKARIINQTTGESIDI